MTFTLIFKAADVSFFQKSLAVMETVANDTADYYGLNRSEHEIDHFCRVSNSLLHTLFSHFVSWLEKMSEGFITVTLNL